MRYELAGAVGLSIGPEVEPRIVRYVRGQMAPYVPVEPAEAEDSGVVRLRALPAGSREWLDIENSAGDGLTTAWDGERAFVLGGGASCSIPDPLRDDQPAFAMEAGFPLWDIWPSIVKPALSLAALRREAAIVHASSVAVDGRAVGVAGWSESGKTEVALALAEAGAAFVSDKWSILTRDRTVAPFPATVGVRRWVVRYLPRLKSGLSAPARVQLAGARVAATLTQPMRARAGGAVVRELSGVAISASEMADRVSMTTQGVRRIYGVTGDPCQPLPLETVVLLTTARTGGRFSLEPIKPAAVAERLAQSAAFERRSYFSIARRIAYATDAAARTSLDDAVAMERDVLTRILSGVRLFRARTDFPQDPRPLAEAILNAVAKGMS
jgi:hypothetical protein